MFIHPVQVGSLMRAQAVLRTLVYLVFALLLATRASAAEIDTVLVIVNDQVITQSEFEQTLARVKSELRARGGEIPPRKRLRQQVLDRMILQKIQLQLAKRLGIEVPDADLQRAMADIAGRNNLTTDQLRAALQRQGMSYQLLRENTRAQMITQQLAERQVVRRVTVTDAQVDAFLARPGTKSSPTRSRYDISDILFKVSRTADEGQIQEVRAKAVEIRRKIIAGMDFDQAAAIYSDASNALEGGKVGWRTPSQLPDLFLEALDNTAPGGVTKVLRGSNGFHILKLNAVEGESPPQVTQYKLRHILVRVDPYTSVKEATRRLEHVRTRIMNGEDFASLALAHSDDTVSSSRGGALGWLSPGDVPRPLWKAVQHLQVGEISQPIQTPYGMDIIQLLDTRIAKSEDIDRSVARRRLRAIKTREKIRQWQDRLRDEAYIRIVNPVV